MTVITLLIALLGLALGSFLNVLVPRLKKRQSLGGRSRCLRCRHQLAARDLFPLVSFILLRGRCRYCHRKISWRYPAVEFATATAFVVLFLRFGFTLDWVVGAMLSLFLIALFVFDLLYRVVPDEVSLPGAGLALVGSIGLGVAYSSLLWGALLGSGFFALQYFVSRGQWVGDGDIRLGLLTGVSLGLRRTLVALVLAYVSGAILSLVLLATKRANFRTQLPFGSLLTAAVFVSFLFGHQIADWYVSGAAFHLLGFDRLADWYFTRQYGL